MTEFFVVPMVIPVIPTQAEIQPARNTLEACSDAAAILPFVILPQAGIQ